MGRHHIIDVEYHSLNGTQTAAAAISLPNRGRVTSTGLDGSLFTTENTQEQRGASLRITDTCGLQIQWLGRFKAKYLPQQKSLFLFGMVSDLSVCL